MKARIKSYIPATTFIMLCETLLQCGWEFDKRAQRWIAGEGADVDYVRKFADIEIEEEVRNGR